MARQFWCRSAVRNQSKYRWTLHSGRSWTTNEIIEDNIIVCVVEMKCKNSPWKCAVALFQRLQHGLTFVARLLRKLVCVRDVVALPLVHRLGADQQTDAIDVFAQQFQRLEGTRVPPEYFVGIDLGIQEIAIVWPQYFTELHGTYRCGSTAVETVARFLWCRIHRLPPAIIAVAQAQVRPIHPHLVPHVIIPNRVWIELLHNASGLVYKVVDG